MPDLFLALHAAKERIHCYSGDFEWLDLGRVEDYQKAIERFEENPRAYLPNGMDNPI
jgi:NDP-sugar pyrophosphorylase family protein